MKILSVHSFPLLHQAVVDMGADNGRVMKASYVFHKLDVDILHSCENALVRMTDREREIIVCGEVTEQQDVIVKYGIDAYVLNTFLFLVFDGPYSGVYE